MIRFSSDGRSGRGKTPPWSPWLFGAGVFAACVLMTEVVSAQPSKIEERPSWRITDRPPKPEPLPPEIQSREESFVQIHGRWVEDAAQCPVTDPASPPASILVTDTLLRWQGRTCSVRDVKKTEGNGEIQALCVSEDDRSEFEFLLRRESPDRMHIQLKGSPQQAVLRRCPR